MSSTRDFKSPGIFAEDATTVIPPTPIAGVAYRDAVTGTDDTPNGWRYGTRVASQDWNQIMFLITSMLGTMDKQGVLGYSSEVDYEVPALVFGSNGLPYLCIQANGPSSTAKDPISEPLYWEQFALHGRVVITTTGASSWPVPVAMQLGMVRPFITVVGGGGGGAVSSVAGIASQPNGGSGGGIAKKVVDLTGVSSVSVTVGAGGAASASNPGAGSSGGNSSFGAFCSATGGGGGSIGPNLNAPGAGVGGDINENIGYGSFAVRDSANGSFLGGYGGGGSSPMAGSGAAPSIFGHGGGGRLATGVAAAGGSQGVVIIEW